MIAAVSGRSSKRLRACLGDAVSCYTCCGWSLLPHPIKTLFQHLHSRSRCLSDIANQIDASLECAATSLSQESILRADVLASSCRFPPETSFGAATADWRMCRRFILSSVRPDRLRACVRANNLPDACRTETHQIA